jgi:hypothetical protein
MPGALWRGLLRHEYGCGGQDVKRPCRGDPAPPERRGVLVHPVAMTVTGTIDKRHVEGKVRGGGPLVQFSCSSESVRIR